MCTDVLIVSQNRDQVVNARSQEFSEPLGYRMIFRKKDVMVKLTLPTKPPGAKKLRFGELLAKPVSVNFGVSNYDYMGIIMTTVDDMGAVKAGTAISTSVFDGMNSAGLSAGSLNFQGASYQPKKEDPTNGTENIFVGFFVDWMLSNFATCEQIKKAFADDRVRVTADASVAGFTDAEVQEAVHQHYTVHDAGGHSLVIEFIDNKAVVTDNPIGVLTNLPVFSWHLTNLGLYTRLTNFSTAHDNPANLDGVIYAPPGSATPEGPTIETAPQYRSTGIPGMGDGLVGIPGDFRPPSRFVRTAFMKKFAVPPTTETEAVSEGFHLLNGVDMVKGASAEIDHGVTKYDTAQIVVVKDLANKKFYLRMYESPMPYVIPFDNCPHFAPGSGDRPDGVEIAIPIRELAQPLSV
jgi:penicillin V acylase-like amidase (Ntn superfamily)